MKIVHPGTASGIRRALSDSLRVRIYETLQLRPRTARELGEALGHKPNRLYYHLRILEEEGLIGEAGRDASGRMVERIFKAIPFGGDSRQVAQAEPADRALLFGSLLEATRSELIDVVIDQAEGRDRKLRFLRAVVRTTPEGFDHMVSGLERLLAEARRAENAPDATDYRLTFTLYEGSNGAPT